jgi:hypothetical protein
MKIRNGFVSNSSSSSFVIISKNELTREKLQEVLSHEAKNFPYGEDVFYSNILNSIKKIDYVLAGWYGLSIPLEVFSDNIYMYTGSHSDNEGCEIQCELCSTNLSVNTDDIKIIWEPRN